MIAMTLSIAALILAALPGGLFLCNLGQYRRLPGISAARLCGLSVLIPARNEEARISAGLQSLLGCEGVELEILVLDDHSSDQTAARVEAFARLDARVRLIRGEVLPAGWGGKNFACAQLAAQARFSVLVFLDADVRVRRADALARLAAFITQGDAQLVSGIPRQEMRSSLEKLIIPLIHFVLLGFLPLGRMRASSDPRFAAACGQVIAVRADAYRQTGGHGAIRSQLHDGVALAREFRRHALRTDLFDADDTFLCRMYESAAEVWKGFSKNAHEGLGSPRLLAASTLILLGGQVLPVALLLAGRGPWVGALAGAALGISLGVRLAAVVRFGQPVGAAFFHPVSIALLVAIQWQAALFRLAGRPILWKGRPASIGETASTAQPCQSAALGLGIDPRAP